MSLYSKYVLPRLINAACGSKDVTELRKLIVPAAKGIVLEIGIGSALNLPYYSRDLAHLYGIDASSNSRMAQLKTEGSLFPVTLLNLTADKIPLEDHSIDTVVVTFVLCSITDCEAALQEMRRVLKRDGRLIFLEHGLAAEPKIQTWQHRLTPVETTPWRMLSKQENRWAHFWRRFCH